MHTYLVTGSDQHGKKQSKLVRASGESAARAMVDFTADRAMIRNDKTGPQTGVAVGDGNTLNGLLFASTIIRAAGLVAALLGLLAAIAVLVGTDAEGRGGLALLSQVVPFVGLLVFGVFLYAFGETMTAIRMIAINSGKEFEQCKAN